MIPELLRYKDKYTYAEYAYMCKTFGSLKLPFLKNYDVSKLLSERIFSVSMNRIQADKKNVIRRFLGSAFSCQYDIVGNIPAETVFVFTGDRENRPDYVSNITKTAAQCEKACILLVNRKKLVFKPWHLLGFFPELIWAIRFNKLLNNFTISFDLAVALHSSVLSGKQLLKYVSKCGAKKIVTYCDQWAGENALTQLARRANIKTVTLQHGNGTEIFFGCCSEYYLANSISSYNNLIDCGVDKQKIRVLGPMKYAGESYRYIKKDKIEKIGIVFDGAKNFKNNVEMLNTIHNALKDKQVTCCIRLHPNNKIEDYKEYIYPSDVIYPDLDEFERDIDVCIVYNSSMYTDMVFKCIPVFRFKNGKVDLYPELNDRGFTNSSELTAILADIVGDWESCAAAQSELYNQIFGEKCNEHSYRDFFKNELQSVDKYYCPNLRS